MPKKRPKRRGPEGRHFSNRKQTTQSASANISDTLLQELPRIKDGKCKTKNLKPQDRKTLKYYGKVFHLQKFDEIAATLIAKKK